MLEAVKPEIKERGRINEAVRAEINLCYACGSCGSECPVNRASNRLNPRKLVWMANLGLANELVEGAEIWYCMRCRRCSHVCPMTVKPATLIGYLRWQAVAEDVVSSDKAREISWLTKRLQYKRYEAVACAQNNSKSGQGGGSGESDRRGICGEDVDRTSTPGNSRFRNLVQQYLGYDTALNACLGCGECSSICPACVDRRIFDPMWIFRMSVLGLEQPLLGSPSLWLCYQCQSCTRTCGQGVKGDLVIRRLQQLAVELGYVDEGFRNRWQQQQKLLYEQHLKEIDILLAAP